MKVTTLLALAAGAFGGLVAAERWVAGLVARGEGPDPVMRMVVLIEAPIEAVWEEIADVERQPLWMSEMKRVRVLSPGPLRVGSRAEADVRIFMVGVVDEVEIDVFEPPFRFGIRHAGAWSGRGLITLEAVDTGRTLVRWTERLWPPVLPALTQALQKPVLGGIFQADLERLKEIVEAGWAETHAGAGADAG
ncbi:MAG: Polyketide cyclase / dehydrase and lipid transport [Chloroflexi bacterium]|jgi:uncharacterized protein YndB with AHSA1/START domain|nr:Polyketide cyclase / dehydrase and lipid transport [Chloroflexota bacterium]